MMVRPFVRVFCKWCGEAYEARQELPNVCPGCRHSAWWQTEDSPSWTYHLTLMDRRLLKALRIAQTE